ncbi:MAG: aldehyde dehydrogenase family protein [Bacteroidota bacterium]
MSVAVKRKTAKKGLDYSQIFESHKKKSLELRKQALGDRIAKLKKLRKWVYGNRKVISDAIYDDFRKPEPESELTETYVVLTELNHAIKHLGEWTKSKSVHTPITYVGSSAKIAYEPKGTSLIIAPWNFPFNLAVGPLVSAIAAGNTAIIKPSEMTPSTSSMVKDMVEELFNEDEVCVIEGGVEETTELLKLPFDHIFFTGSPGVGKIVMKAASENLSSITLELGGKSPFIIDPKANLEDAAEKLVWGKFMNNGQTCIAPDYVLVHSSVKQELIDNIRVKINAYFNADGNGIEKSEDYGRIVNTKHFDRLASMIENAIEFGFELEFGGEVNKKELYISPTVFSDVDLKSELMQEEIFGPILPILTYDHIDEVISLVNSKSKPLAIYVFSTNSTFIKAIDAETSSGTMVINDCVIHFLHPNLPFGGVNTSGIGKSHGYHGFLAFSNEKAMLKQRIGLTSLKPLYPPYTTAIKKLVSILVKNF